MTSQIWNNIYILTLRSLLLPVWLHLLAACYKKEGVEKLFINHWRNISLIITRSNRNRFSGRFKPSFWSKAGPSWKFCNSKVKRVLDYLELILKHVKSEHKKCFSRGNWPLALRLLRLCIAVILKIDFLCLSDFKSHHLLRLLLLHVNYIQ